MTTALSALLSDPFPALLTLADGRQFHGFSLHDDHYDICAEVVFHTGMTGYQEVLTDPSYAKQFITFTYPHIGNTGTNDDDFESAKMHASGAIMQHRPTKCSNWRSQASLPSFLNDENKPGIYGIDTRALTTYIRQHGNMGACLQTGNSIDPTKALQQAKAFGSLSGQNLAEHVSTDEPYEWQEASWQQNISDTNSAAPHIVVIDFGVKQNILRLLKDRGARITVLPYTTTLNEICKLQPDGILLSNGPGDPLACTKAIALTNELLEQNIPLLGICLGFQILANCLGAKTIKMTLGHHGANHPVVDTETGLVDVTSQNHNFAVADGDLPDDIIITHRSLFDNTIQGLKHTHLPVFGVQGHPEASPGPKEHSRIFDEFFELIKQQRQT